MELPGTRHKRKKRSMCAYVPRSLWVGPAIFIARMPADGSRKPAQHQQGCRAGRGACSSKLNALSESHAGMRDATCARSHRCTLGGEEIDRFTYMQSAQSPLSPSHLRHASADPIWRLPFRHPLPNFHGSTGNGRAFFGLYLARCHRCTWQKHECRIVSAFGKTQRHLSASLTVSR